MGGMKAHMVVMGVGSEVGVVWRCHLGGMNWKL